MYIKDTGWKQEYNQYSQSFYEMMDFIYYPSDEAKYADKYLTAPEVTEVIDMINFLTNLADDLIKKYENQI